MGLRGRVRNWYVMLSLEGFDGDPPTTKPYPTPVADDHPTTAQQSYESEWSLQSCMLYSWRMRVLLIPLDFDQARFGGPRGIADQRD